MFKMCFRRNRVASWVAFWPLRESSGITGVVPSRDLSTTSVHVWRRFDPSSSPSASKLAYPTDLALKFVRLSRVVPKAVPKSFQYLRRA
jgi:hypothetical protein